MLTINAAPECKRATEQFVNEAVLLLQHSLCECVVSFPASGSNLIREQRIFGVSEIARVASQGWAEHRIAGPGDRMTYHCPHIVKVYNVGRRNIDSG